MQQKNRVIRTFAQKLPNFTMAHAKLVIIHARNSGISRFGRHSSTVGVTGTAPAKLCLPLNYRTPAAVGAAAAKDRTSGSQFLIRG